MTRQQERENLEYLQAHVAAVHGGLQALLDLLVAQPEGHMLRAASLQALLLPLASEAEQAEPLARMLVEADEVPA